MVGSFYRNDIIVISHYVPSIKMALDVLDGKAPSLSVGTDGVSGGGGFMINGRLPANTVVYLEAAGMHRAANLQARSPMVRQLKRIIVSLTSDQQAVQGRIDLTTAGDQPETN